MRVRLSGPAVADLDEIAAYLAQFSPASAVRVVMELQAACLELASLKVRHPLLRGAEDLELRQKVHRRYRIIYRIEGQTIRIVRILHGARDYERLLFKGE